MKNPIPDKPKSKCSAKAHLLKALQRYGERLPDEMLFVQRFIGFIRENPDAFMRSLTTGHITASAWLINKAGTHVLLIKHRKLGIWVQPGGHADGNTDLLQVSYTEAFEETGLHALTPVSEEIFDIDIHQVPDAGAELAHLHYDIRFAWQQTTPETLRGNHESTALAWVEMVRLTEYTTEPSILRMADKWQALQSHA